METLVESELLKPYQYKSLALKNRLVMAPMTRSRAIGNVPNDLVAEYYKQRASAGLIVTEGTAPSPNGIGYARTPGIYSETQIQAWKKITDAVHENGGKIFMQLMHVGRISHPLNTVKGAKIVAPSAIAASGGMWTDQEGMQPMPVPHALTTDEVQDTIVEFARAAKNAVEAGFDGAELHAANGYLLEQFLNPYVNLREDEYGGTIKNRIRFALEATKAVANAIGREKVGVRISPFNTFNGQPFYDETIPTYEALVHELNKLDIIYLHMSRLAALSVPEGPGLLKNLRHIFKNVFILAGGYDKDSAEKDLEEEKADLIAFAKYFISNPDLPLRFKEDATLAEPDTKLFYSSGREGYIDYPFYKI